MTSTKLIEERPKEFEALYTQVFGQEKRAPASPPVDGVYNNHDELNTELRRRLCSHPTAALRPDGTVHVQGLCHNGKSTGVNGALAVFPSGAVMCTNGCEYEVILRSFGLPERPNGNGHAKNEAPFPDEQDAPKHRGIFGTPEREPGGDDEPYSPSAETETTTENTNPQSDGLKPFSPDLVMKAGDLCRLEIEPREDVLNGILYKPALAMICGPRGKGKTHLCFSFAGSIANGTPFLAWKTPKRRRVLYVDGELPLIDLKERAAAHFGNSFPELLDFISSEVFYKTEGVPLTLNNEVHQRRLLLLLDELQKAGRGAEVIFLDNLSALTQGVDENSNSEQDSFLQFLIRLRHLGYTVPFVHHTGKNNEQRGASRREDFLDLSWRLADPPEPSFDGSARFVLEFSKLRRKMPEVRSLECTLIENEHGLLSWEFSKVTPEKIDGWIVCLRFCQTMKPENQTEIVERLKTTKGTVSKHVGLARKKGMLKDLSVTPKGAQFLAGIYEET